MSTQPDESVPVSELLNQRLGRAIIRARAVALVCGKRTIDYCIFVDEEDAEVDVLLTRAEARRNIFPSRPKEFLTTFVALAKTCAADEFVIALKRRKGGASLFKRGVDVQWRRPSAPENVADGGGILRGDLTPALARNVLFGLMRARFLVQRFGFDPCDVCLLVDETEPVGHDLLFPVAEARARYPALEQQFNDRLQRVVDAQTNDAFIAVVREVNGKTHVLALGTRDDEAAESHSLVRPGHE